MFGDCEYNIFAHNRIDFIKQELMFFYIFKEDIIIIYK